MPTKRCIFGALVLGTTAATSLIASPARRSEAAERAGGDTAASEYVVSFANHQGMAARRAIAAAGGTILDVNPELDMALVRASAAGFQDTLDKIPAIAGVVLNHSVGLERMGMPHRFADERPPAAEAARAAQDRATSADDTAHAAALAPGVEPLASRQWDMAMIGANQDGAWSKATGRGVDVGVIDTGIDGSHPDLAPNFDATRSHNFTTDIPSIDGPCEVPTCVDPADTDDRGHGTHVAGTIAAARNGFGIAGVAPDARLVSLRAGQDSGYFFLYETAKALTAAGDEGLDVVNMSFYTDPWLYNCDSADDYLAGRVTKKQLDQQRLTRQIIDHALRYAHDHGVTLVAAAGNEHANLAADQRPDPFSPGYPPGTNTARVVTKDCIDMPAEGPYVIDVGAVGPSGTKADYSNYGKGAIGITAPGGWIRDRVGTPHYNKPENMVLSSYPSHAAIAQGLADSAGEPTDDFSLRHCNLLGVCGFYTYLQGTSMAAPHVVGTVALIVERYGQGSPTTGYSLTPDKVEEILMRTAADHPCPAGGVLTYDKVGRPSGWDAICEGDSHDNGLYGTGIVDAAAAVR